LTFYVRICKRHQGIDEESSSDEEEEY
jgi:hypothetical protein